MYQQSQQPQRQQPVAVPYQQQQIPPPQVVQAYQQPTQPTQPVYQPYQPYQAYQPQVDYHEGEESLPNYQVPQQQQRQQAQQQQVILVQPQYGVTPYVQQQQQHVTPSFSGVPQPNIPQIMQPYTPLVDPTADMSYEEALKHNLQEGKCCGFMSHRTGFLVSVIAQFLLQILLEIILGDAIYWYFIITIMCALGFIGGYKYLFKYSFHMVTVFTLYSIAMGLLFIITLAFINVAVYIAAGYSGIRFLQVIKRTKKKYNKTVC